jgi:hypothetical protein
MLFIRLAVLGSLPASVTVDRVHLEMPFLEALVSFVEFHLPSAHKHLTEMGPVSASCLQGLALWFLFPFFLPLHQCPPSLCFFLFLVWKQNPMLLLSSLSCHPVSAVV